YRIPERRSWPVYPGRASAGTGGVPNLAETPGGRAAGTERADTPGAVIVRDTVLASPPVSSRTNSAHEPGRSRGLALRARRIARSPVTLSQLASRRGGI